MSFPPKIRIWGCDPGSDAKTGRASEYGLSVLPESITYLYSLIYIYIPSTFGQDIELIIKNVSVYVVGSVRNGYLLVTPVVTGY